MVEDIPINQLRENSYNPRKHFDDARMKELENSIKHQGVIQAITVRPLEELNEKEEELYEVVAGIRRFKVCKNLDLKSIPALILPLTDEEAKLLSITENLERANLTPMEEARAYADYLNWDEQASFESRPITGFRQLVDGFSQTLPISSFTIYNRLSLSHLPESLQTRVDQGKDGLKIKTAQVLTSLKSLWKIYKDSGVPEDKIKSKIHEDMIFISGQVKSEEDARDRVKKYIRTANENLIRTVAQVASVKKKFDKAEEKILKFVNSQELPEDIAKGTIKEKHEWLKASINDAIKALSNESLNRISALRANAAVQCDRYKLNLVFVKELVLEDCPYCGAGVSVQNLLKRIDELVIEIKKLNDEEGEVGKELTTLRASKKKLNALVREYNAQERVLTEAMRGAEERRG